MLCSGVMDCNIEELQRLGFPMTTATDADNAHHCDVNAEEMQGLCLIVCELVAFCVTMHPML